MSDAGLIKPRRPRRPQATKSEIAACRAAIPDQIVRKNRPESIQVKKHSYIEGRTGQRVLWHGLRTLLDRTISRHVDQHALTILQATEQSEQKVRQRMVGGNHNDDAHMADTAWYGVGPDQDQGRDDDEDGISALQIDPELRSEDEQAACGQEFLRRWEAAEAGGGDEHDREQRIRRDRGVFFPDEGDEAEPEDLS